MMQEISNVEIILGVVLKESLTWSFKQNLTVPWPISVVAMHFFPSDARVLGVRLPLT